MALDTNYGPEALEVPPRLRFGRWMIRRGVASDAPVLAALARHTFFDTFAATNDAGDMAIHLERAYGVAQQAAELADPRIVTLLVECRSESTSRSA